MKTIQLGKNGMEAIVDDEDFDFLNQFKWHSQKGSKTYYAVRWLWDGRGERTRYVAMHRAVLGIIDPKKDIDHKDRNGLNNQRSNLRLCPSKGFNIANGLPQKGRKWKGCYLSKSNRWIAKIAAIYLSSHDTEEEAARAYDEAAKKRYGEFARLNFPNQACPN